MRQINLTQLTARMLRENLVGQNYDYLNLKKIEWLSEKLIGLQGPFAEQWAAWTLEEKAARRALRKHEITEKQLLEQLNNMRLDIEEAEEIAATVPVSLLVEEADWKLIKDCIESKGEDGTRKWLAGDNVRPRIFEMVDAILEAAEVDVEAKTDKGEESDKEPLSMAAAGHGKRK